MSPINKKLNLPRKTKPEKIVLSNSERKMNDSRYNCPKPVRKSHKNVYESDLQAPQYLSTKLKLSSELLKNREEILTSSQKAESTTVNLGNGECSVKLINIEGNEPETNNWIDAAIAQALSAQEQSGENTMPDESNIIKIKKLKARINNLTLVKTKYANEPDRPDKIIASEEGSSILKLNIDPTRRLHVRKYVFRIKRINVIANRFVIERENQEQDNVPRDTAETEEEPSEIEYIINVKKKSTNISHFKASVKKRGEIPNQTDGIKTYDIDKFVINIQRLKFIKNSVSMA